MKKFENIMIVSDLDGTFFSSSTEVVPRNVEWIRYFIENGGLFTFATGRVAAHLTTRIPKACDYVNFPAVTCNGMVLFDIATGKEVEEHFSDVDKIIETVEFFRDRYPSLGYRGHTREGVIYFQPDNPYIKRERETSRMPMKFLPFEEWGNEKLYKLTLRADGDTLEKVKRELEEAFPSVYTISLSWVDLLETQPYGISKASMLADIKANFLREGREIKLYAVGDYENDIEMLSMADVAVCPANAIDSVKRICDLCLCDNDTGVIADLIEYLDRN
ncbi:MAG: HAD-IIB family hydrolase [Clostridia bacterium]|nr:HAD-IIB family hydrolase [Clostridia bacterium]